MKYRFQEFDPASLGATQEEQLKKLFLEMLMQMGGDVEGALEWLDEVAQRYGLWPDGQDVDDFKEMLEAQGYIKSERPSGKGKNKEAQPPRYKPTRKAEQAIRVDAFSELFSKMRPDAMGGSHATPYSGAGGDRLPETRQFVFGDRAQDIDTLGSMSNALRRGGSDEHGDFDMTEEDLAVYEVEQTSSCATVLALDISHSMILYGEDRITPAKKVAMALTELIQTRFKKDSLDVILFGDDAMQIEPSQLPFVQVGPYHTNTQAALELAQAILARKKHANKQIVMITDGKPSAMRDGGRLYINSVGLDARIVNRTVEEAQACRRKRIVITTFMITSDPYLKKFVERMSEANKGRAFYADLNNLGKFVMMDYVRNRKKAV